MILISLITNISPVQKRKVTLPAKISPREFYSRIQSFDIGGGAVADKCGPMGKNYSLPHS